MPKAFIGTSGFSYFHWQGIFYPQDLKQNDWLSYYSKHFDTVEINATFYRQMKPETFKKWRKIAGDACLPAALQAVVKTEVSQNRLQPVEVLESLTDIRHQTAVNEIGQPEDRSLRATRVILRETVFEAELTLQPLDSDTPLTDLDRGLLAACVKALRRGGVNRNRGCGRLRATLWQDNVDQTDALFAHFEQEVWPQ